MDIPSRRRRIYFRGTTPEPDGSAEKPRAQEGEIAAAGDDDVVQQTDVEQRRGTGDPLGQRPVLRTGFSRSGGMVVNENELRGEQLQGAL